MLFGIITLFPEMFNAVTHYGVVGKSVRNGIISVKLWNPREFSRNSYKKVDDYPYGGGAGMLMSSQPLKEAITAAQNTLGEGSKVIYLSPQGKRLNHKYVCKLAQNEKNLILVCGRYQGIDERIIQMKINEEWSIGDYVLSGGELAAMVFIDTIARVLPGTLNNQESKRSNSFFKNRLNYPHYTRPEVFEGMRVPAILLSGNHGQISRWRLKQSLGRTWLKRPDLLKKLNLSKEEKILLTEFKNEYLVSLSNE
ncbi:tRNA (guanine-N1)-methyltransferase [Candidatus Blochmanniella vafra str. BVAF]|uniref:tRNA (guanine-N(1)-)-methyltransferase n=1 Tax=Blochmanniella vafra (strain BVAF) TaxID=859654 RepID=E8Q5T4_BLOVB|nr:tRNA (guanosine(37)-N1)-methyltransferase TrmD [Candidatus Blochmannia vafer]ADV33581.1 tRNA (guanine-N1)-methyltransferase [Candidatus Blochmannia vafer str. BVAF]